MNYNEESLKVLNRVSDYYGKELMRYEPIECAKSIGIEIEIKFQHYFPEIYQKYFQDRTWDSYSYGEKEIIDEEITLIENRIGVKHTLEKILELGIKKGNDCYWEFALDPITDLSLLLTQLQLLLDLDVLPKGEHSLHLTVGDLKSSENTYWIMFLSELLFSSKSRISSGFDTERKRTYFRKGKAGLLEKRWRLVGCEYATEFRTLELIVDNKFGLSITHKKLTYLSNLINNTDFLKEEISKVLIIFDSLGLPNSNWGNYKDNTEVWNNYLDNFEKIKSSLFEDKDIFPDI